MSNTDFYKDVLEKLAESLLVAVSVILLIFLILIVLCKSCY